MSDHQQSANDSPVIALYTPYLQGSYIGELINQIRQLTYIKGYRLVIIRTGGYGEFHQPLALERIDAAIILRNAIAPALAEALCAAQVVCVSIAYDYFPLAIPVVATDNEAGVELAFAHLRSLGHQQIAFVGDLSHYDIRKRYEFYCQLHDQNHLPLRDDYLFSVDDSYFAGGIKAAQQFLHNSCDASAVIFGAGQTGIGFVQHMRQASREQSSAPRDYVCFDALSMIPVFTPELASVDQNLHLLAYRALNAIDHQLDGQQVKPSTKVEPKLTRVSSNPGDSYDAFIATCVDLPELRDANYMKSLISNFYDWPREILNSELDQLMSIAPLFQRFMARATLSRYHIDSKGSAWTRVSKIFFPSETSRAEASDSSNLSKASRFPPPAIACEYNHYDTCVHVPIFVQGKIWGLLSLFGEASSPTPASSYFGFSGYIETLIKMYEQELELTALTKRLSRPREDKVQEAPIQADTRAEIHWDLRSNQTSWGDAALAKLGYTTPVEINVYKHLDITDRVHPDDFEHARAAISKCKTSSTPLQFRLRYRLKSQLYREAIFTSEPRADQRQNITDIVFSLNLEEPEH